jgi:hypothetical protein
LPFLYFGKANYYDPAVVKMYAERLLNFDPDAVVLLLDHDAEKNVDTKIFVASIDMRSFLGLLNPDPGGVVNAIIVRDRGYLARSGFTFKGVRKNKTNVLALKEMRELEVTVLAVLNERNEPVAIVKRNDLLAHIAEQLAE